MNFLKNKIFKSILTIIVLVIMILSLFFYLMYADLSTAPEFIYNQF